MPDRGLVILVLLAMCCGLGPACAQPPEIQFMFDPPGVPAASGIGAEAPLPMEEMELSLNELVERLRRTEARLTRLEGERAESPGADQAGDVASAPADRAPPEPPPPAEAEWYEKYGLRGYAQFRLNEVLRQQRGSAPPHHVGDASVADHQNFLIRRARLILSGDVSDHMFVYLQPDFAVTPPGSPDATHFVQIRDWYADIYCDTTKVYRFRVGQSKVPYGWENLQSSQNRIPLDRNDALNSAVRNERDLGVFFYWTPQYAQDVFQFIMDEGLKGSGNYGVWGLGVYNGQGGSLTEQNDNVHVVSRVAYPFALANGQIVELGVQGYTGRYVVLSSPISPLGVGAPIRPAGTREAGDRRGIRDERIAWTAVYYPQPLGFQAEWTVGRGPALDDAQTEVVDRPLYGGYAMTMYRYRSNYGEWFPFVRWAFFKGGYKSERNAPFSRIDELELGVEWQINRQMELVAMYTITDRTNTVAVDVPDALSYRQFVGNILRFQFQINY